MEHEARLINDDSTSWVDIFYKETLVFCEIIYCLPFSTTSSWFCGTSMCEYSPTILTPLASGTPCEQSMTLKPPSQPVSPTIPCSSSSRTQSANPNNRGHHLRCHTCRPNDCSSLKHPKRQHRRAKRVKTMGLAYYQTTAFAHPGPHTASLDLARNPGRALPRDLKKHVKARVRRGDTDCSKSAPAYRTGRDR